MGPNKAIVRGDAIYDARTGRLIQDGLTNEHVLTDYASHHYLVLPEVARQDSHGCSMVNPCTAFKALGTRRWTNIDRICAVAPIVVGWPFGLRRSP